MKVVLFGATGMVGQGTLEQCLLDPEVTEVLAVGRTPTGKTHPKLSELAHSDFTNFTSVEKELTGYDACLFCLGVSSAGMKEPEYRRVTYDFTLAAAETLAKVNPGMTFVFISGMGTDSGSKTMWARVKGETEDALLKLPFKAAYMFRPGFIRPPKGVKSKTALYNFFYLLIGWSYPVVRALAPKAAITGEELGRAMLRAAKQGAPKPIVEGLDIGALAVMR